MTKEARQTRPIGAVRISTIALCGVIAAVSVPAVAAAITVSGRVDNRHATQQIAAAGPISRVVIEDSESDVTVTGDPAATGAGGQAVVEWQAARGKKGNRPSLEQSVDNGVLTLKKVCIPGGCGSVHITLRVPKDVSVQATTSDGRIQVSDVTGSVDLTSTNGSLEGNRLAAGEASFRTTNGSVTADFAGAPGRIRVDTTDGDVTITTDGRTAYFDSVQASNGTETLTNPQDRTATHEIDVKTSNGSVTIK